MEISGILKLVFWQKVKVFNFLISLQKNTPHVLLYFIRCHTYNINEHEFLNKHMYWSQAKFLFGGGVKFEKNSASNILHIIAGIST